VTEDEARNWVIARFGQEKMELLAHLAEIVTAENKYQNLVSRTSLLSIWNRHLVDSAQLMELVLDTGLWLDVGTGGGFPGLAIAALRTDPVVLCEPRRRRADFLERAAAIMGLPNVRVEARKVSSLSRMTAAIVSARAVASIDVLLRDTRAVSSRRTKFVFPRGRSGADELSAAKRNWQGMFHVKQSITDADSMIVTATEVRPS
jgi:16S rRNA (guanine527-N7)-methyltransferase